MANHIDVVENDVEAEVQRRIATLTLTSEGVQVGDGFDREAERLIKVVIDGADSIEKATMAILRETPYLVTGGHPYKACAFLTSNVKPMRSAGSVAELRRLRRGAQVGEAVGEPARLSVGH